MTREQWTPWICLLSLLLNLAVWIKLVLR